MRNIILASTLAIAALSGVANASSPAVATGPGDVQLALSAGVEPGQFTRSELLNILDARSENDTTKLNFYLTGENRVQGQPSSASIGQLAASAGVRDGDFTAAQLSQLAEARRENDVTTVNFILNGSAKPAAAAEVVTPGEAMLAAIVGVDPAQYTLAELVALQPQADN